MPGKRKKAGEENIESGMVVEATKGDLGEEDVSKPRVSAVSRNKDGEVEELTVQKGVIFKKKLDIPADRVQSVAPDNQDENNSGKVIVDVGKEEAASLTAVGEEELSSEEQKGLLEKVERDVPTAEGLRRLEASNTARRVKRKPAQPVAGKTQPSPQKSPAQASEAGDGKTTSRRKGTHFLFHVLGPGFLGGMAGNDASAVGAYSGPGWLPSLYCLPAHLTRWREPSAGRLAWRKNPGKTRAST